MAAPPKLPGSYIAGSSAVDRVEPLDEEVRDMNEGSDATRVGAIGMTVASERVLWGRSHQSLTCNSVAPVSGLRRDGIGRGPRG
jgi:hypothetical protein